MAVFETTRAILDVLGGLAGGTGLLYAAAQRNAISTFKADNDALRGLNQTLQTLNLEQTKQIDTLRMTNDVLRDTIGAGPQLAKLSSDIAGQHKEVLQALGNVATALADITKNLSTKHARQTRRS